MNIDLIREIIENLPENSKFGGECGETEHLRDLIIMFGTAICLTAGLSAEEVADNMCHDSKEKQ